MTDEKAKAGSGYTYWKRQCEDADMLPPNEPQRLDVSATSASSELENAHSQSSSRWNTAGTWEEKDVGKRARTELERVLCQDSFVLFEGEESRISCTSATVTGDAQVYHIRGTSRLGYEFKVKLKWKGTFEGKEVSGRINVADFDSTDVDGVEIKATPNEAADVASNKAAVALRRSAKLALKTAIKQVADTVLS